MSSDDQLEVVALPTDADEALEAATAEPTGRRFRLPSWIRGDSPVITYIGVGLAVLGFLLILLAWGQVAGETKVYLQLPYLVSAGLTGLGFIMVGLTVVNVAAKQRDAADRDRQMDQLVSIMEELKSVLGDQAPTPTQGRRRR